VSADRYDWLADASEQTRGEIAAALSSEERAALPYHWPFWARDAQLPPPGDWRAWLIMAGRGFGKTRAGAEWVRMVAENDGSARIALVASSLSEARAVMIEGESGIMACCAPESRPHFESVRRRLIFPNGAEAKLFSAAEPESLRGPQHSHAWCDEIGKWPLASDAATRCWDNLLMGLRLGTDPRIAVTTTPRSVPLVRRLLEGQGDGSTAVTRGKTSDNAQHLPQRFLDAMEAEYAGSLLARQELDGELVDNVEGALWSRELIESARASNAPADLVNGLTRVVVAVDPPASANGDACGIVVAAIDASGTAHVLADCSVEQASPESWARAVAQSAEHWSADRVIAEANQGGAMVESVLRAADCALPIKLVHATRGKSARAEPVAALYEVGRVKHHGLFAQLEDQLCGLMPGGEYHGPGRSPDRADALVWALSELCLGRARSPRIKPI
jgi:phage terminase large subunit-like protein